jgi:hypothetical protein
VPLRHLCRDDSRSFRRGEWKGRFKCLKQNGPLRANALTSASASNVPTARPKQPGPPSIHWTSIAPACFGRRLSLPRIPCGSR